MANFHFHNFQLFPVQHHIHPERNKYNFGIKNKISSAKSFEFWCFLLTHTQAALQNLTPIVIIAKQIDKNVLSIFLNDPNPNLRIISQSRRKQAIFFFKQCSTINENLADFFLIIGIRNNTEYPVT